MTLRDAVRERIRDHMRRRKLTQKQLAQMCGVEMRTVSRLLNGHTMGEDTLELVSDALCLDWTWREGCTRCRDVPRSGVEVRHGRRGIKP